MLIFLEERIMDSENNFNSTVENTDKLDNDFQANEVIDTPVETKKSIFKKWWFWLIIGVVIAVIVSTIIVSTSDSSDDDYSGNDGYYGNYTPTTNYYVSAVKNTKKSGYGVTYGSAFNSFFSSPSWDYFYSSGGKHIVEFEGYCYVSNVKSKVLIQFTIASDMSSFTATYGEIAGDPMNTLELGALIKKVFESY
jgi:hypothetical protein